MENLIDILIYAVAFVFVISVVTLVHEFGHYIVAKFCGVKVEEFSIGFGKALKSWTDKAGTVWKVAMLPCGGYVKMFGDAGAESNPDLEKLTMMSEADKKISFFYQPAHKKLAIILAGPVMNFLLCIALITIQISIRGTFLPVPPVVMSVVENSSASRAGITPGDRITHVNWHKVKNFDDIKRWISRNTDEDIVLRVERNGSIRHFIVRSEWLTVPVCDPATQPPQQKGIGILSAEYSVQKVNPLRAFVIASVRTYDFSVYTLKSLKDLFIGKVSVDELGGPIKIAQYSGESAKQGPLALLLLIAVLSSNIGLLNLLPVPALDGGHCVFYLVELVTRREIPSKIKEKSTMICFLLLIGLLIAVTVNDLRQILF